MKKVLLVCLFLGFSINCFADSVVNSKGLWVNRVTTDQIDDTKTFYAYLPSPTGVSRFGKPIYLAITCSNNKTDLYIDWETFIGTSDHNVTVRLGEEKAFTKKWIISNDNTTSFYPTSPVSFLKKLSLSKTMVVRVTPYNDNDLTVSFDLTGADKALQEVRRECKW